MWHVFAILAGSVLVVVGLWDQCRTILGEGGGPITRRAAGGVWRVGRWANDRFSDKRWLSVGGVCAVLVTVTCWIAIQWLGWSLIFIGTPRSVSMADTDATTTIVEQTYFAGYTLSTLGLGDAAPGSGVSRLLTATASFCGLFMVSFAVGYLIPVIVSATQKRKLAIYVSCLGESSTDLLLNMWDGESFYPLSECLRSLTPELALLEQRHLSYPVLPYLHSDKRAGAIGPALAVLDEALTTLILGVDSEQLRSPAVPPGDAFAHRRAISTLLETLAGRGNVSEETPPVPSLRPLRAAGIPTVDDELFERRVALLSDRRRSLHHIVQLEGWRWDSVESSSSSVARPQLTSLYSTADL